MAKFFKRTVLALAREDSSLLPNPLPPLPNQIESESDVVVAYAYAVLAMLNGSGEGRKLDTAWATDFEDQECLDQICQQHAGWISIRKQCGANILSRA